MRGVSQERGASAVEFAIVLTVLVLVLFGTIQFGMAYNRSQGLQAGAREGARLASTGATFTEIEARVRAAQSLFQELDVVVETTPAAAGADRPCAIAGVGGTVVVNAKVLPSTKYAIVIPLWGNRQIEYQGGGTFRCERGSS